MKKIIIAATIATLSGTVFAGEREPNTYQNDVDTVLSEMTLMSTDGQHEISSATESNHLQTSQHAGVSSVIQYHPLRDPGRS